MNDLTRAAIVTSRPWAKLASNALIAMACFVGVSGCKRNEPVPPPQATINPNPVKGYKVLLNFSDPRGKPSVMADIAYAIDNNEDCVPLDRARALGGIHPKFHRSVTVPAVALSEPSYEVTFFDDYFQSEDYYGHGKCNWIGSPTVRIRVGSDEVIAQVKVSEEMLGVGVVKLCPVDSTWPHNLCMEAEYARKALDEYFPIETVATRSK